jgi:hypothetical protein
MSGLSLRNTALADARTMLTLAISGFGAPAWKEQIGAQPALGGI